MIVGFLLVGARAQSKEKCPDPSSSGGVYESEIFADGVVRFEAFADRHSPLAAVLYRTGDNCSKLVFDKYDRVGGLPRVESVFPHTVHGKRNLFVIISWATDHSGLGIKGTSYQVYAYQNDGNGGLQQNPAIRDVDQMFGIEGMDDFKDSHYFGKNPAEVRRLVDELGLN